MSIRSSSNNAPIKQVRVVSYTIPTDQPESDGTLAWNSTTLVVAHIVASDCEGLGYGYADTATACLIHDKLGPLLMDRDALATNACWENMAIAVRNLGRTGIGAMAISILDTALWDWKAKYFRQPLNLLLGATRDVIPVYGSGGFTSYSCDQLENQLGAWAQQGFQRVKMKVGREPAHDSQRVACAAKSIGKEVELFVDANGAYSRKQALAMARQFSEYNVSWFEEPVSSDDLAGLRLLRDRAPAGMAISAGEYGYDLMYFRRLLEAGAVDVLQADATRCGGITGFLGAAALCEAFNIPLSSHCAPSLHVAVCCAARPAVHLEYFHDHARIETMLFDGTPLPRNGTLTSNGEAGLGLIFKEQDAQCFRN